MLRANATHGKPLAEIGVAAVVDAAQRLLDAEPLTPGEIGARLAERWPETPPGSLAEAARSLLPLVQVPPRALWQRSGQVRLSTATAWVGKPCGKPLTIDDLLLRYVAAFGPASAADVQTWSGLTRLSEVLERLDLVRLKSEGGQTLYDLRGAPRPDPDRPAPVRLVAPFDNILLSHADRRRGDLRRASQAVVRGKERSVSRHGTGRRVRRRDVGTGRQGRVDQHAGAALRRTGRHGGCGCGGGKSVAGGRLWRDEA
jgi:hypothetical protein